MLTAGPRDEDSGKGFGTCYHQVTYGTGHRSCLLISAKEFGTLIFEVMYEKVYRDLYPGAVECGSVRPQP
jgi:hypothetical protein